MDYILGLDRKIEMIVATMIYHFVLAGAALRGNELMFFCFVVSCYAWITLIITGFVQPQPPNYAINIFKRLRLL